MSKNELAKLMQVIFFECFGTLEEFYEDGDTEGMKDELYEILDNMDCEDV